MAKITSTDEGHARDQQEAGWDEVTEGGSLNCENQNLASKRMAGRVKTSFETVEKVSS